MLNAHDDVVLFTLPGVTRGEGWRRLLDTNQPEQIDGCDMAPGEVYQLTARSLVLFGLRPEGRRMRIIEETVKELQEIGEEQERGFGQP
jgi:isoamylase